jgi:hypothetical protein
MVMLTALFALLALAFMVSFFGANTDNQFQGGITTDGNPQIIKLRDQLMKFLSPDAVPIQEAKEANVCAMCGKDALAFTDYRSADEYRISQLCQACQDGVFVASDDDMEPPPTPMEELSYLERQERYLLERRRTANTRYLIRRDMIRRSLK